MTTDIALHEVRHLLGCACALVEMDLAKHYSTTGVVLDIKTNSGEFAPELPDAFPRDQMQRLGALTAAAALDCDDPVQLFRDGAPADADLTKMGLSDRDIDLISADKDMPMLQPLRVLLAVKNIEKRLGRDGVRELCKAAHGVSNQKYDDFSIADFVPLKVAKRAVTAARSKVTKALNA